MMAGTGKGGRNRFDGRTAFGQKARRPEGQKAIDPQMWNVIHFPALGILAKRVVWHQ